MRIRTLFVSHPKRNEERLKLGAGGCQLIAIAICGAAFIAPLFNTTLNPPYARMFGAAVVAAVLETIAMRLLGYLPIPAEPTASQETRNG